MIKRLAVFDFDGTLFRSPEPTDENKKLYEKHTGIPWHISKDMAKHLSKKFKKTIHPRTGWWGKDETLMPPLVPEPVPSTFWINNTLKSLTQSRSCQNSKTLIMTGRHLKMRQSILRLLYQSNVVSVKAINTKEHEFHYEWTDPLVDLLLLGSNGPCPENAGPKPEDTFPWKVWIINQYRSIYKNLEEIEIWEDRDEHVEKFLALDAEFQEKVIVHHVKE